MPPSCVDGQLNGDETGLDCGGGCPACTGTGVTGDACRGNADCESMLCAEGMCVQATCADQIRNGGETDVDCGGPCSPCSDGRHCIARRDCQSVVCDGGRCATASCDDDHHNGDETDVDCGGSCEPCDAGLVCSNDDDCVDRVCQSGICQPAACDDQRFNGTETDVDCGGRCDPCFEGLVCRANADCVDRLCLGNHCAPPTCNDGVENGQETWVDCGGPDCGPCDEGRGCAQPGDCFSGVCDAGACRESSCVDGLLNEGETDVDCGGLCAPCGAGLVCLGDADCRSSRCVDGRCAAHTCEDGRQNGIETWVDCGGDCGPCPVGRPCRHATECDSGVCEAGICAPANCLDRAQNGLETGVDCGGRCPVCPEGTGCVNDDDCVTDACVNGLCAAPTCLDGRHNGAEAGIDCGGECPACADGTICNAAADCLSGICAGGRCAPSGCADGLQNGLETGVDCGGPCAPCLDGIQCRAGADCLSGVCADSACAPAACDDGLRNGAETAADCGGAQCPVCPDASTCIAGDDCLSGVCTGGRCVEPTCNDGLRNGGEQGIDCGGPCGPCPVGRPCLGPSDCGSGVCEALTCAAPTCGDGVRNGTETGVDCGGDCPTCADGVTCQADGDCLSAICTDNRCAPPACDDGVRNGGETAVDCGGPCGPCPDASACARGADCASGVCSGDVCAASACNDGVRNGTETGLDCGGPDCAACADGGTCSEGTDCRSRVCADGRCAAPTCADLVQNGAETAADCGGLCPACPDGRLCTLPGDCESGVCTDGACTAATCVDGVQNGAETAVDCGGDCPNACPTGSLCTVGGDCVEGICTNNHCSAATCDDGVRNGTETAVDCGGGNCPACGVGDLCTIASDCITSACRAGRCAASACNDRIANGDETDTDCGGSCGPCPNAAQCRIASDCASNRCVAGRCAVPACDDGVQNGVETDVDCGGPCGPCLNGRRCAVADDCINGVCGDGICVPAACNDLVQNGDETSVDCGGSCGPCMDGLACAGNGDCINRLCAGNVCVAAACDDGVQNGVETGTDCGGGICAACPIDGGCRRDGDCAEGLCLGNICSQHPCRNGVQDDGEADVDCGGICAGCLANRACAVNSDCAAFDCRGGTCYVLSPALDAVAPTEVTFLGGVELTLDGSNFQVGVQVLVNGAEVATTRVNATQLHVTPPASTAGPGPIDLRVVNPDGGFVDLPGAARYIAEGIEANITTPQGTFCDPFTCAATGLDIIDPANPLPASYRWELNGQPVNGAAETLQGGLAVDDVIQCIATVGPMGNTWEVRSLPFTVLDGVASAADLTVGPDQPVVGEGIRCTATPQPTNCGGDTQIAYAWYVNGTLDPARTGSVYPTGALAEGDAVECHVAAVSPAGRLGSFLASAPVQMTAGQYTILSTEPGDAMGAQVSVSADLSGDDFNDILIGAPNASPNPETAQAGQVYAVGGKRDVADQQIDTAALFTLHGESGGRAVQRYGNVLSVLAVGGLDTQPLGDVFGFSVTRRTRFFDDDAVPDFAVGAPAALSTAGDPIAGRAYMISGASASGLQRMDASVDTLIGGTGRTRPNAGDTLGARMVLVQDFNGDGYDDLVASAPRQGANLDGNMYILPGGTSIGQVDISDTASLQQGRVVDFTLPPTRFDGFTTEWGQYFGDGGDLDGDGLGDLWLNPTSYWPSTTSYVIWGRESTRRIDLTDGRETSVPFGANFIPSYTAVNQLAEGRSQARNMAASGGDFNGDGLDDLIYSTLRPNGQTELVGLFGRADRALPSINQLVAGNGGFAIDAIPGPRTFQGAMGDINGDGYDDIVVGHPEWNNSQGQVIVVYGRPDAPTPLWNDLVNAGEGFTLDGPWSASRFGHSVDVGDVNGDGLADIVVGAPARAEGGAVMVYFGRDDRGDVTVRGSASAETLTGTAGADVIVGQGGDDTIDGQGGDDAINGGRGEDTIIISDTAFRRVDGGPGLDTLRSAGGIALDLTQLNGRVRNIERIDLTAAGADRLVVDAPRIMRNTGGARTLWVTGNAEDTVVASGSGWVVGPLTTVDGLVWRRFDDGPVKLMVRGDANVLLAPTIETQGLTLLESDPVGDLQASDIAGIASYQLIDASNTLTVDGNGVVRVAPGGSPNFEQNPIFDVRAIITNNDNIATERTLTVRVSNVDEPPFFPMGTPTAFTVQEAVEQGRVLHRYVATDPEGLTPTLTLSDPSGQFELLEDGTVRLINGEALDFERTPTIDMVLTATDPAGNATALDLTVTVGDLESLTTTFRHTYFVRYQGLAGPQAQERLRFPLSGLSITGRDQDFGINTGPIRATVSATGSVDFGLEGYYDSGSLGMTWPVEINITIPDRIVPGRNIRVSSNFTALDGGVMSAILPEYFLRASLVLNNFAARFTSCVGLCQEGNEGPFSVRPVFERTFYDRGETVTGVASADKRTYRGTGPAWRTVLIDERVPWDSYADLAMQRLGIPALIVTAPGNPTGNMRQRRGPPTNMIGNRQIFDMGIGTLEATIWGIDLFGTVTLEEDVTASLDNLFARLRFEDGSGVNFFINNESDLTFQVPAGADANGDGRVEATVEVELVSTITNNRTFVGDLRLRKILGHTLFTPVNPRAQPAEGGPIIERIVGYRPRDPENSTWTPTSSTVTHPLPLQLAP
ncbi:MAG: IPT/TIG domain-containing protein [Bradymonadia bacterium]